MRREWNTTTDSEDRTIELGRAIGAILRPGDVVLMTGDLGSGKTRLAKGMVSRAAGVSPDDVVSPTFTLVNTFEGPVDVHHADFYRIGAAEIEDLGLDDMLEDAALVIEWAGKVEGLDYDPLEIRIDSGPDENIRGIRLTWDSEGAWAERATELIEAWGDGGVGTRSASPDSDEDRGP